MSSKAADLGLYVRVIFFCSVFIKLSGTEQEAKPIKGEAEARTGLAGPQCTSADTAYVKTYSKTHHTGREP